MLIELPQEPMTSSSAQGPGGGSGPGMGDGHLTGIQLSAQKGPLIMNTLYGNRLSGGDRDGAIGQYGDPRINTESAVMNALRWLKKNQNSDGSWDGKSGGSSGSAPDAAMTGWAVLAYLAHGETPTSEEFGPTVEKAIKHLVAIRDAAGGWPRSYQHAIATYAICEAYGMTRIPMLKDAAMKAIDIIIQGQNPKGGWRYTLTPADDSDTSCMGWCAQALKAADLARVGHERLESSMRQAVKGFKGNASPAGGFGYTAPGEGGLSGVGVLCMQMLGAGREPEVRQGIAWLDRATCEWAKPWLGYPLYYWYYTTQAKFHAGGDIWNAWNRQFSPELMKSQIVIKKAIQGMDGQMKDIGYWEAPGKGEAAHGLVYNTALCCLMLEVYYRNLPTYQPQQDKTADDMLTSVNLKIDVVN